MTMRVFIPTNRAMQYQRAYHQLTDAGVEAMLVTDQHKGYEEANYMVARCKPGIAAKRRWIMRHLHPADTVCMIDDDITIRRVIRSDKIEDGKLAQVGGVVGVREANAVELRHLFRIVAPHLLRRYAHGGMHPRLFVNYAAKGKGNYPYQDTNGFYRQVNFYNPALFKRKVEFDLTAESGEDLWMVVCLALQGLRWFKITEYCYEERNSKEAPPNWTMEFKRQVVDMLLQRVDPKYVARGKAGTRFNFRKMCLDNEE